ncbi:unnamed protein product [Calypogeia fissa]
MDVGVDPTQLHQSLDRLCETLVQSIGSAESQTNRREQRQRAKTSVQPYLREDELPTSSGYLPVGKSSGSRLFYAFYEASSSSAPVDETPLILWLNGGPGCSSLIGCFYELGPWIVDENGEIHSNPWSWNRRYGVLFVDSPAGTGFSVEESSNDIPRDSETVAQQLLHAVHHFVTDNGGFRSRPLFLAGESYAGKYLPALAYYILNQPNGNGGHKLASQLAGIMIGNGFTDPRTQVQCHADVAMSFGLLDKRQAGRVRRIAQEVVALVDRKEWVKSYERRTDLCNFIEKTSGVATLLDIRRSTKYHHAQDGREFLAEFLNSPGIKTALNVDSATDWVSCNRKVRSCMIQDTMKSAKWMVEAILRTGFPVLLYQGMYDVKDGPASSEAWMRSLDWQGSSMFWKGERTCWKVNGELAGYWRQGLNLTHVVVAGAGHQVPADQPLFSQVMIETWIQEQLTGKRPKII